MEQLNDCNCSQNNPSTCFDQGPAPFMIDLQQAVMDNKNFRTTLWSGTNLQLILMCIPPLSETGMELHPELDQFSYIQSGKGLVAMGNHQWTVCKNCSILIPINTWHNLINTENHPLKLYCIYAPPKHPKKTMHPTKEYADLMKINNGIQEFSTFR